MAAGSDAGPSEVQETTLRQLCATDKQKVANMIRQVVVLGQKAERSTQAFQEDSQRQSERLRRARDRYRQVARDNKSVRDKLTQAFVLLRAYQRKVEATQQSPKPVECRHTPCCDTQAQHHLRQGSLHLHSSCCRKQPQASQSQMQQHPQAHEQPLLRPSGRHSACSPFDPTSLHPSDLQGASASARLLHTVQATLDELRSVAEASCSEPFSPTVQSACTAERQASPPAGLNVRVSEARIPVEASSMQRWLEHNDDIQLCPGGPDCPPTPHLRHTHALHSQAKHCTHTSIFHGSSIQDQHPDVGRCSSPHMNRHPHEHRPSLARQTDANGKWELESQHSSIASSYWSGSLLDLVTEVEQLLQQ